MQTAPTKPEKETGWEQAFDRQEPESRGQEKPVHVLNARQLEFAAHIKRMQKEKRELV